MGSPDPSGIFFVAGILYFCPGMKIGRKPPARPPRAGSKEISCFFIKQTSALQKKSPKP
jgi:hypothetical protein